MKRPEWRFNNHCSYLNSVGTTKSRELHLSSTSGLLRISGDFYDFSAKFPCGWNAHDLLVCEITFAQNDHASCLVGQIEAIRFPSYQLPLAIHWSYFHLNAVCPAALLGQTGSLALNDTISLLPGEFTFMLLSLWSGPEISEIFEHPELIGAINN